MNTLIYLCYFSVIAMFIYSISSQILTDLKSPRVQNEINEIVLNEMVEEVIELDDPVYVELQESEPIQELSVYELDLQELGIRELRKMCIDAGFKGSGRWNKQKCIEALTE